MHVSDETKDTYTAALLKFDGLMTWALDSIGDAGAPPNVPIIFGPEREILASHVRTWRAPAKLVSTNGVQKPTFKIKCAAQVVYNREKGGVDGSTQMLEQMTATNCVHLPLEPMLVLRSVKHMVANAFVLYRLFKVMTSGDAWTGVTEYRNLANKYAPCKDFAYSLALDIVRSSAASGSGAPTPSPQRPKRGSPVLSAAARQELRTKRPRKTADLHKFHNVNMHDLRLDRHIGHELHRNRAQRGGKRPVASVCPICKLRATWSCRTCNVALHKSVPAGNSLSCFDLYHKREDLNTIAHR